MKCSSKYCLVILFFIQTATYSQTIADSVITYETADGLTLLLNKQILFSDNKEGITEIEIWKRTNQKWVSIGKLMPIENWLTIKQAVDTVKITYFMQQKKLSSDADAWLFLRNHPLVSLEEYGPIGTNVLFLEKCGLVFTDKKIHSASADSFIQYKISYKKKGADITKEVSYKKTSNPPMDKPLFLKAKETDSLIAITWAAKLQLNTEPFIAQVYQAVGSTNNFKPTKKIWSKQTEKGDSVYYYFSDKVLPNIQYGYFLQTIHPNGEKSTLSDTVTLFAANFSKISSVNNVKIIDTTDGLLLKWDTLQNNNLLIGIVIQRSSDNGQNYFPIDTIATSAVKYFDATVLPGVKYHYSIDLLTIRRNIITSPVKLMSIYSAKLTTAPPPIGLTAKGFNDSIVLNWNKVNDKHFYAFWVYRSTAGDSVWQKISNELKENYYTDTSIHNSNIVYKYAVRCVNQQLKPSVFSVPAYATVTNKMKPLSVIGLKAFYDGIESFLSWKPNFSFENDVKGYIVYRKKIDKNDSTTHHSIPQSAKELKAKGFIQLNTDMLNIAFFLDTSTLIPGTYKYAISAISTTGGESDIDNYVDITVKATPILAPDNFIIQLHENGVIISWQPSLQKNIKAYQVYKRSLNNNKVVLVATVSANQGYFIDETAKKGDILFYSLKIVGDYTESNYSVEKRIQLK